MRPQVILVSSSPRRADLLRQIGVSFEVRISGVEEVRKNHEPPENYVRRLAIAKASAIGDADLPRLAADTTVVLDGQILEKPCDSEGAFQMLSALQGCQHTVLTAIAMCDNDRIASEIASAEVVFRNIAEDELRQYCATEEPLDKAGAYGIQGIGGIFIAGICGQPSTVTGLPLVETNRMLTAFGVDVWLNRLNTGPTPSRS